MIKKKVLLLLMTVLSLQNAHVSAESVSVPLQVSYQDHTGNETGRNRVPARIPNISIDGFTLIFDTPCDGFELRLLNEYGDIEYITTIPVGADSIQIPSYLEGSYEIQIIHGGFCFWGIVKL